MALLPAGRAIAKTWVSAARTPSDQGLRLRMIDHFNEPASRATSEVDALCPSPYRRNAPPGVGPPFVLRQIEGKQESRSWGDGRDGRGYQLRAAPTPLTVDRAGHRSTALLNSFVARGIFAFCLPSLRLCYEFREAQEREASTWQAPLVALCSSHPTAHSPQRLPRLHLHLHRPPPPCVMCGWPVVWSGLWSRCRPAVRLLSCCCCCLMWLGAGGQASAGRASRAASGPGPEARGPCQRPRRPPAAPRPQPPPGSRHQAVGPGS
jgi:hypothetical protein